MNRIERLKIAIRILEAERDRKPVRWKYGYDGAAWFAGITANLFSNIGSGYDIRIVEEPDADGWIPWSGGECPVDGNVKVDVKFRNGTCELRQYPDFRWGHSAFLPETDIVAYRISKEPEYIPLSTDDVVSGMEFMDTNGMRCAWGVVDPKGSNEMDVRIAGTWYSMNELMENGWKYRIGNGEWKLCRKEKP